MMSIIFSIFLLAAAYFIVVKDLGIIPFITTFVLLIITAFIEEYYDKLTIEKDKKPIASAFAKLFVEPKLRPRGTSLSRVTVYSDMIIAKHTRIYAGRYRFAKDVVNLDTGMSTFENYVFKFLENRTYRFAHIITRESIINYEHNENTNTVVIKYMDVDHQTHTLTIKKPYINIRSYQKLITEIQKFVK